jgi:hypothetical protein
MRDRELPFIAGEHALTTNIVDRGVQMSQPNVEPCLAEPERLDEQGPQNGRATRALTARVHVFTFRVESNIESFIGMGNASASIAASE